MPCIVVLLALLAPRLTLVLVYLFSDTLQQAYDGWLLPVLGFIFLPLATLAYAFAVTVGSGLQGIWLVVFVIAVIVDVASFGGARMRRG